MPNESEKHTIFQTKMVNIYTLFSDQNRPKPILFGALHTYITHIRENPRDDGQPTI